MIVREHSDANSAIMTGMDLISGLVTPIVVIASTLSYAPLIFSDP
jgi:hypothetical protein